MRALTLAVSACALLLAVPAHAQWNGLTDESAALGTDTFPFFGPHPEAGGNENYYDGDFGDFNGDGLPDRLIGARYGLLLNTGGGVMVPIRRHVGLLLRGDPGASGWGEDAMAMIDVDSDGDLDALAGGNGEPLTCQANHGWRFQTLWTTSRSALNIVPTDIDRDGDVDLAVAFAFCSVGCGSGQFSLLVNDGTGQYTEEANARGLGFDGSTDHIVGIASGDVDRDGDFDLVLARGNSNTKSIVVAINDGTGNFTQNSTTIPINCSGFAQALSLGDLDGDGDLDLAVGRCPGDTPTATQYPGGHPVVRNVVAFNDGMGNFTDESATRFDTGARTDIIAGANIVLVDIDYDEDLDMLSLMTNRTVTPFTFELFVLLNDGSGNLVFSPTHSMTFPKRVQDGLGADIDVSDLDGDGDLDVWLGGGSDLVHILLNTHTDPGGVEVDVPRDLRVVSEDASGITIGWKAPRFASNVRYYRVYRSLAQRFGSLDRTMVKVAGHSAHLDQDFFASLGPATLAVELADPDVTVDPVTGEVQWIDRSAVPGVSYHYAVAHVGPEADQSSQTSAVEAAAPPAGGADDTGPQLEIVAPAADDWYDHPRIVLGWGDESGVDPTTLDVSFDTALGTYGAGQNLATAGTSTDDGFVAFFDPAAELPDDTLVTLTASVDDNAGNTTTESVSFFVTTLPSFYDSTSAPTASITASSTSGTAPLTVDFDASASSDPDGYVLRTEWYFGDGGTGFGKQTSYTFEAGGTFDVTVLVRDSHGNVDTATETITVGPPVMNPDMGMGGDMGGNGGADMGGDAGTCTPDCAGRVCGDDGCGGTCGSCDPGTTCASGACLCQGATQPCGNECVDLRNDADHCGACDDACEEGLVCNARSCEEDTGTCTPDCDGRSCGDDGCGGTCGACDDGQTCANGGQCLCAGGETACGTDCADVRSDSDHCGACDTACAADEVCSNAECVADGSPNQSDSAGEGCNCTAAPAPRSETALLMILTLLGLVTARRTRRANLRRSSSRRSNGA